MYTVVHSKKSAAAVPKLRAAGLEGKARGLIAVIREDPYRPPVEKLRGDLRGKWARRATAAARRSASARLIDEISVFGQTPGDCTILLRREGVRTRRHAISGRCSAPPYGS